MAIMRTLWAETNCEDMTRETGSIVNVRSETMFNAAIATYTAPRLRHCPFSAAFHDLEIGRHAKTRQLVVVIDPMMMTQAT